MRKVKRKYELIDKGLFYLVFALWLISDSGNKFLVYSPLGILALYHLLNIFLGRKRVEYFNRSFKFFPLILLLGWLYGVIVGLFNDNDYIFINNAGILFFGTYYSLSYNQLDIKQILKIVFNLSLISCLYILLTFSFDGFNFSLSRKTGFTLMAIFPVSILPYLNYHIFFSRRKRNIIAKKYVLVVALLLVGFTSVYLVYSKGIFLSLIITYLCLFLLYFNDQGLTKFPFKLVLIVVVFSALIPKDIWGEVTIFGSQEAGNEVRYDFVQPIIKELAIQGKGWGAIYEDPYLRQRNGLGYSSELSYLNLIHKVGFFSIIYFYFYIWSFSHVAKCMVSYKSRKLNTALLSLGLLTYLFLALGNPLLFAPMFVFMHVVVIHILNKVFI